jgi:putative ABC transport system permease protein
MQYRIVTNQRKLRAGIQRMSHVKRFVLRLLNLFRRNHAERQVARELDSHLRLMQDDFERRGLTPDEARLAARRAFGGIEQARELQRDARSFPWLEDTRRDIGYAVRMFRRSPGFATIAALTLALGIGANTAVFTVVHAVLLKPLPYPDSDRLVRFVEIAPPADGSPAAVRRPVSLTLSDLGSFRDQARSLSHAGVYTPLTAMLTGRSDALRVPIVRLSPAVLSMLRVRPAIGRIFESREETPGADSVVVLSHRFWQRQFAASPDAIGQNMTLDGKSYSIVGVMPAGFYFPDPQTELWLPYALGGSALRARMSPVARVADGVPIEAAAAAAGSVLRRFATATSPAKSTASRIELEQLHEQLVAPVKPALNVLSVAVTFVLAIACVNVANLVLGRSAARQREMAVRRAIGAGRARLIRQLLTESMLLASIGGLAGVGLAFAGVRWLHKLAAILPRSDLAAELGIPRLDEIGIDTTVFGFTLIVTAITGMLAGLAPVIRLSRSSDSDVLRQGISSPDFGFGFLRGHRVESLLVTGQIALAMLLLVSGGLLIRSFVKLSAVDPGYDPGVLTFVVYSPRPAAPSTRAPSADEIVKALQALPEVRAAGYAELLPLVRFRSGVRLRTTPDFPSTPPAPPAPGTQVPPELPDTRVVSRDFLDAMGIRIIEGRGFGRDDTADGPKVLLINRTLARSGFLGAHPVGARVYAAGKAPWQVVGIVDDVRQYGLDRAPDPQIFIDARQLPIGNPNPYFVIRSNSQPSEIIARIRTIVKQLDREAVVDNVATMEQLVSNSVSGPRLNAVLMAIFSAVAGLLAIVGVYGALTYYVARRTREIGIRVALGAHRREVMKLVMGRAFALTAAGAALGVASAIVGTRYLERLLFGLSTLDPITFVCVPAVFAGVAMAASYLPARRATKVDPMVALRAE